MPHAISIIPTRDGSRLIKRLCTHWAHKLQVQFDESQAHVPFDADTRLWLEAGAEALQAGPEDPHAARLARMKGVGAGHLPRTSRGTPEDSSVGNELCSTLRFRWGPFIEKKKTNKKI